MAVYLVGAGPGAADLLTLRAARLLAEPDVVFHDALVHPEVLALAHRAELVAVGKRRGRHSTAQRFINRRLVDAARKHRVAVRLKGGDPMLTRRGVSRTVVFATPRAGDGEPANDWATSVAHADTAVIYMGAGEAAAIAERLLALGKPASLPVAVVENASLPGSRRWSTTLGALPALAGEAFRGPVIVLLGEVLSEAAEHDALLRAAETRRLRSGT
jgi:uroporphyrin-III C-methyltransferase